jgi:Ca2+-binding RTX toxin-like protein
MTTTTDPLDALLFVRDGQITARWNFVDAVGSPVSAPAGLGNAVSLSYSFLSAAPTYNPTAGFAGFSAAAREATREALETVSAAARVAFNEVAGVGAITFGMNAQGGGAGYAFIPSFSYTSSGGEIVSVTAQKLAGDVWLDSTEGWTAADFEPGRNGSGILVHEIGHALGLKHPFEADSPGGFTLAPAFDNKAWTVMSYTEHPKGLFRTVTDNGGGSFSWVYEYIQPETLMPYDIAALRHLYGANTAHRTGNDSYTFDTARPFIKTIVDAGGIDTISVANFSRGCVIDLRDGHFSSIRILSDALPAGVTETHTDIYDGTDNLAIAFGVLIENATGGSGADRLTGNAAANVLDGGGGNDTMAGGNGSDTYRVAQAGDVVSETQAGASSGGTDLVCSWLAAYTLGANLENGRIMSAASANLSGNTLNNVLFAGAGNNVLNGGSGTDTADYRHAAAAVTVSLVPTTGQATGGSGTDTLLGIERLTGSSLADKLTGNAGANTLNGAAGADTLTGGSGNDTYYVDNLGDRLVESSAGGTDTVYSSLATYTLGANVEGGRINTSATAGITGNSLNNSIRAGAGNNILDGGSGIDTVDYGTAAGAVAVSLASTATQATGGSGSDRLSGFENIVGSRHNDTLAGNGGANQITGAAGADRLTGGAGADRFVMNSLSGSDTITDFLSGSDKIIVSQAAIRIGDGDTTVDGAMTRSAPGGFAPSAEWVLFTANIAGSITASSAAAKIGSAVAAYNVGAKALFMVDNGAASALYLFTAAGADAAVSAAELSLLATLSATPSAVMTDLLFGA